MSDYRAPLPEIRFALTALAGLPDLLQAGPFADFDMDTVDQVLEAAGSFATDVLSPLNVPGDHAGCRVEDRAVVVADGFSDAYQQFVENGWQSVSGPPEFGGTGLPHLVSMATAEMWHGANMSFALCPLLTGSAIMAVAEHCNDALKATYLPKLVSGEWSGTMVLTEPHAGSDLGALTTRATREGNHYRIRGTKIFITWGDHPMAENTVHLVLARLDDAPDGVGGISMFLVPKYLPNDDGSPGERNDVYPVSVEHKMGIHASPTCVLSFGESEGAVGFLVGEENRGLANMFTMMNNARLDVGIQGLGISERAYQRARVYARERIQGRAIGVEGRAPIINHPDVRRMLLVMKAQIEAMRSAAYDVGAALDTAHSATEEEVRDDANARIALLTPVIKAWLTETAQEITSLGVQVHGGMGFVEETGAAQQMRDARILPIYEGTTGIQANDFIGRKILGDEGREIRRLIADMRTTLDHLEDDEFAGRAFAQSVDELEQTVGWILERGKDSPVEPLSAGANALMQCGIVVGGWHAVRALIAARHSDNEYEPGFLEARKHTAEFYCGHILPRAKAYAGAACAGSGVLLALDEQHL